MVFNYRGRLEHLLYTLMLCLNVGLYFVNMEMIVGLDKKVTFEVLKDSPLFSMCVVSSLWFVFN